MLKHLWFFKFGQFFPLWQYMQGFSDKKSIYKPLDKKVKNGYTVCVYKTLWGCKGFDGGFAVR